MVAQRSYKRDIYLIYFEIEFTRFYLFQVKLFNNSLTNLIPQRWLSSQVHRNLKQKVMGAVVNLKSYLIQKLPIKRQRKVPVSTLCSVKIMIKLLAYPAIFIVIELSKLSCNFRQWDYFFYDLLLLSFFFSLAKKVTTYLVLKVT